MTETGFFGRKPGDKKCLSHAEICALPVPYFDSPAARIALVVWERASWSVVSAARYSEASYEQLLNQAELLFGPSPWLQVQIIEAFGRLGSVEAAVAALAPPAVLDLPSSYLARARPGRSVIGSPKAAPAPLVPPVRSKSDPRQGRLL